MNRTPPNGTQAGGAAGRAAGGAAGGATGGADGPPTNPRGQNPQGPIVNRGEDVRAALENAERLVAQTTTRLAAEEARAIALDQQVQAMQAQGPSILAALDSQTTNKVPRWSGAQGDFSAELWLNQVEMLRTCLLYTSPSPRDLSTSRMPSSA